MDTELFSLAADALQRTKGLDLPQGRPQLLAWSKGFGLLKDAQGVRETPAADIPASVDLSPIIDHTLLKADAQAGDIAHLCEEARRFRFASVCVNPMWVEAAAAHLKGSPVRVCTVVGFPLGATLSGAKAEEARQAYRCGAQEIDMVLAIGLAKSGDWEGVKRDMAAVREAVPDALVKVILETCLLTDDEKRKACTLAVEEGLDYVKTSTGFSTGGATEGDVRLMRETVGVRAGVKASGGVRTYADALKMVQAGATRLGLSSSLAVVQGKSGAASGAY